MLFQRKTPKLEFRCAREDHGVIAPPVPAKTILPEWFRKVPAVDKSKLATVEKTMTARL